MAEDAKVTISIGAVDAGAVLEVGPTWADDSEPTWLRLNSAFRIQILPGQRAVIDEDGLRILPLVRTSGSEAGGDG